MYCVLSVDVVVIRSKPRRLLLLNDQLVCAAVSGRASEAGEASSCSYHDGGGGFTLSY